MNELGPGAYEAHQAWLKESGFPHDERVSTEGVAPARLDVSGQDLSGIDLGGANLYKALAHGADLTSANLANVNIGHMDLSAAKLTGAVGLPTAPVVEDIKAKVLAEAGGGEGLYMANFHCDGKHCLAGWAITLAGSEGRELEEAHGPGVAGALIFQAGCGEIPHFVATKAEAMEWLNS